MPNKNAIHIHETDNDLTHSMVHYLLAIHKLKEEKGYARVTDIAKIMNVTKGSVSTALNNLKKRQLVVEDESKFLTLSSSGHDHVHSILTSRTLLYYFLKDFLGITEEIAHKDSCLMEHLLSDESREKLFILMQKLSNKKQEVFFKTDLDIHQFSDHADFSEAQKGDKYL